MDERRYLVRQMREAGASWREIGAALGVSRQRAQQLATTEGPSAPAGPGVSRRYRGAEDLTHMRYGRLTVVARAGTTTHGHALWHCVCDCGQRTISRASNLKSGQAQSCGCLVREKLTRYYQRGRGAK